MKDKRQAGRDVLRGMFGDEWAADFEAKIEQGGFGAAGSAHALEACFGDIWARPGLSPRDRSLVTLGMIMGLRTPVQFKNHVRAALSHGLTAAEVEEVVLQAIPYLGYPTCAVASAAAREALEEAGVAFGGQPGPSAS